MKGTLDYGLLLNDLQYEVYSDASFANREKDRTSISGYLVLIAGTCISWCSCKQACVALSTAESELIALSEGPKESEWLWHLLNEMGFKLRSPVQIWCDSKAAISVIQNPGNHKATKHIETRYLYTRDLVHKGRVNITYCNTKDMLADLLTKPLPIKQFKILKHRMGVHNLTKDTPRTLSGSVRC